jgi:hypothetical protein
MSNLNACILIGMTFLISFGHSQISFTSGDHSLEISGAISTYYNYRFYKDGQTDFKKNRYRLRDAQLQLEGRYKNKIEYEFQADFADLAASSSGAVDPENPGLMDASVTFKYIPMLNITAGYGKLPYGRSSLVPFIYSPYWQRAELVRGDIFSRRDVGITLSSSFWKQRVNLFLGAYNGLGELSLRGDNDATGKLEYIARAEVAYPSRYRNRDIDDRITPTPMFVVGANARHTNRPLAPGRFFPQGAQGEYLIKIIDGKKQGIGLDASFQYMGFSAQFEMHRFHLYPQSENNAIFQGTTPEFNEGLVKVGGFYTQFNYFSKPLKSIISARYETLNLNDLAPGELRRMSLAYAFQFNGFTTMIKAQYFMNFKEEINIDPLNWTEQFRIGLQHTFK